MELLRILVTLALVVIGLILLSGMVVLNREQLRQTRDELGIRLRTALPFVGLLGGVLAFNAIFRGEAHEVSWWIGFEITPMIMNIEGEFVARLQDVLLSGPATVFFSFIYVYGYVFLLVFPIIAYFMMRRLATFKSLTVAYAANYGIGLLLYIIFIALGPRNYITDVVAQPMYTEYPDFQLLTSQINEYSNVFPSLHTSLSATVMLFAWRTRETFPRWMPLAMFIGSAVILSTMYLAIHWLVDVIAGLGLAFVSYSLGIWAIEGEFTWPSPKSAWAKLRESARRT